MIRRLVITLVATLVVIGGVFTANLVAGYKPSLGLDLQGGASVTLTPIGDFDDDALTVAVEIIRQRVDSIGVAEPEIVRQGDAVVVNLPGVKDQQRALELVGRSGSVEMRPVIQMAENPDATTTTTTAAPGATTTTTAATSTTLAEPAGGVGSARRVATPVTTVPTTDSVDPNTGLAPGQTVLPGRDDGMLYLVGPAEATGEVFSNDSSAQISAGSWVVVAQLRKGADGEGLWNALATKCYNGGADCPTKAIAIVLDGEVISAPVVQEPTFTGGSVQISGSFTERDAKDLAKILQFGAVPVKFDIPTVQTVSATLGSDSLRAAIIAGLIGVLLVMIFLIFYYRIMALVAVGGLALSGMLLWSAISWLSKTNGLALTLSGTAGIIISIGVTVDTYVVFFEKLKDDVGKGRSMRNSAVRGFNSAWKTIMTANFVSLLAAVILWWLTVGSVRGFAFFMGLATVVGMVISYFYTRPAVILLSRTKMMNKGHLFGVGVSQSNEGSGS
jgi:preprotein translocase subunit SecD